MRETKLPRGLSRTKRGERHYEYTFEHAPWRRRFLNLHDTKPACDKKAKAQFQFYVEHGYLPDDGSGKEYTFARCCDRLLDTKKSLTMYPDLKASLERICMLNLGPSTLGDMAISGVTPHVISRAIVEIGSIPKLAQGNRPVEAGAVIGKKRARDFCDYMRQVIVRAYEDELLLHCGWKTRHTQEKELVHADPPTAPHQESERRYSVAESSLLTRKTDKVDERYTLEMLFLFCTAMRAGEVKKALVEHIDFEKGSIYTWSIKGRRRRLIPRLIPLHPVLRAALRWWIDEGWELHYARKPSGGDPLFPAVKDTGKGISWNTLRNHIEIAHRESGVALVTGRKAHGARHSFLTEARILGVEGTARAATHGDAKRGEIVDVYASADWVAAQSTMLRFDWLGELSDWENLTNTSQNKVGVIGRTSVETSVADFGIPDLELI